jgi:8-oxo-dGTP pyrophosphatase MutT (NUDIX family)
MPERLDADRIRRVLSATKMPADPLNVDFTHLGERMPEHLVTRLRPRLRPAGVLIPIIERGSDLSVLLTERSADLTHHAGQVSFPGGGMEAHDTHIMATALRETHEEVGIRPSQVDVAGYLEPTATITGFAVTSVIGFVDPAFVLEPDPKEVEKVFEVPFEFLMEETNASYSQRPFEGANIRVVSFDYQGHRIWGATAGIILTLKRTLLKVN